MLRSVWCFFSLSWMLCSLPDIYGWLPSAPKSPIVTSTGHQLRTTLFRSAAVESTESSSSAMDDADDIDVLTTTTAVSSSSTSTTIPTPNVSSGTTKTPFTLDGQEIRQPLTALNNILIVKVKDALSSTGGGILLPDQSKQRPTEGLVLVSGPGKLHPFTGIRIPNPIHVGMSVVYGQYDGKPIEYNGEECQIIRDDNVLLAYTGVTIRLDNVIPIRDYVLIELDSKGNAGSKGNSGDGSGGSNTIATTSGIMIAASVLKDDVPCEGRVVKIGEGRMSSLGTMTPSPVQVGDSVKFKEYAGNDVIIEGVQYSVVKMVDILCTFAA